MILRVLLYTLTGGILALILPTLLAVLSTQPRTYTPTAAPTARVAIVFGAGLLRDGSPSPILRDRVATAVDLYRAGKVEKLLMSGDNRFAEYNEPGAMQAYAIGLGVPEEDIVLDYAGRRTYDTCFRARDIFSVNQVLLVTQAYHLPRALFICRGLGLDASGVIADRREYRRTAHNFYRLREMPAITMAVWDVWISRPLPVLGAPEPIFPTSELSQK